MKSTVLTAILVCAFVFAFAPELFAQSSNPIQKQPETIDDKPFAKFDSNVSCLAPSVVDSLIIELQNDPTNLANLVKNGVPRALKLVRSKHLWVRTFTLSGWFR